MNTRGCLSRTAGSERAFFDHGWLKTHRSFSFADYQDPENETWGALRVFNDDVVEPGEGFGKHPHRDMEIVTYVLDGQLEHKDSMGNVGVVNPGGVQFMSAGTGIAHSEYNHSQERSLPYAFEPGRLGFIFVADGEIHICNESVIWLLYTEVMPSELTVSRPSISLAAD